VEPTTGLEHMTLRLRPELRSRVRCLTNWATQAPLEFPCFRTFGCTGPGVVRHSHVHGGRLRSARLPSHRDREIRPQIMGDCGMTEITFPLLLFWFSSSLLWFVCTPWLDLTFLFTESIPLNKPRVTEVSFEGKAFWMIWPNGFREGVFQAGME